MKAASLTRLLQLGSQALPIGGYSHSQGLESAIERKMVTDYGVRRDDVEGYSGMAKRTVYVIDRTGTVRAAVIDFGGFLGVGSRKIVVDWNALHFGRVTDKSDSITLELTKAQVAAAPEYKEDKPIVVLGAAGNLQPLDDH